MTFNLRSKKLKPNHSVDTNSDKTQQSTRHIVMLYDGLATNVKYPANIYLFKVKYRNPRKICEICSKLTIKTPELHQ